MEYDILDKIARDSGGNLPKIIFQTWKNREPEGRMLACHMSWKRHFPEPEWYHVLWTDSENRKFISEIYPQYIELYDSFPREIYRVDFVRYAFLHRFGGIYADMDYYCNTRFDQLLDMEEGARIAPSVIPCDRGMTNAMMISLPGQKFWIGVMDEIAKRFGDIKHNVRALSGKNGIVLSITGPAMLSDVAARWGVSALPLQFNGKFARHECECTWAPVSVKVASMIAISAVVAILLIYILMLYLTHY